MLMKIHYRLIKLNGNQTLRRLIYYLGYKSIIYIGSGRFSNCYEIENDQDTFVLKVFNSNDVKRRRCKLSREGRIIKILDDPCFPRLIQKVDKDGIYGIIMDKKPGQSLKQLTEEFDYPFSKSSIIHIIMLLIEKVVVLHNNGIIHNDIKTDNILFDGHEVYLVDFGSARGIGRNKLSVAVDFWGIGDVFLTLAFFSGELSYPDCHSVEELNLTPKEKKVIKKLIHIEDSYPDVNDLLNDFNKCFYYDTI